MIQNDFLRRFTSDPENVWINLGVTLAAIILGILFHFLVFRILKGISRNSEKPAYKIIREKLETPAFFLFILLSILIAIPVLKLRGFASNTMNHIMSLALIATGAWIAAMCVQALRRIILRKYNIQVKDNLRARKIQTQFRILERIIIFIIILVAIGIALMTFEKIRQIGISMLTSAGIAGIILGFAAQKMIATVIAGFQIAITQPIRIEDVVIVEGEWGWIEEINLTFIVVRLWDKRRLVLPTTYFIEQPFQNWTRNASDIVGTVYLYTDYMVPVDAIREELDHILEKSDLWDREVKVVQVTDIKERTIEVRILVSAVDSPSTWDLRVYVREKMIEFLREKYPDSLPKTRVHLQEPARKEESTQAKM